MSNNTNSELLDRAAEMVDYWEGTLHAELIRKALDENDLEQVLKATANAEAEASMQETFGTGDIPEQYGSEEMYARAEELRDSLREDGHAV